ncbi:5-oxoprolinase subunit PxpB [Paenibacillus sp. RRE4]|uniref:5-oxoprolinase subunit PxpB n=1 Tax=Paenibacillus sp. RRE4 TaxID=2962587 RepID=UPI00288207C1|nr:5-oxoprolinase subunit PxpB [Paenibacillus sp. RRE4]MDT0125100.1 5-oxoprolinase subunit PxpB [Paenibacillus sp. RRE4]
MNTITYDWTDDMLSPLGECGIVIRCGDTLSDGVHQRVMSVCALLEKGSVPATVEWVPSYLSVTLFYDPWISSYQETSRLLLQHLRQLNEKIQPNDLRKSTRIVTIPVCYGREFGPDLEYVANEHGLTIEEVITIHSSVDYLVHMIGFAPGFPYLGGLPEQIATPRRATPRLQVEVGTVGIGGSQTGIYPITTPGGWQCIGRTPIRLFRPETNPPSLLEAGDFVRFKPITMPEYLELERREGKG